MNLLAFTKMHGLGNDYIFVNCFENQIANPAECSRIISDRHFGIGADGLVLIQPSTKADFRMRIFNADGSEAEMCGNAIRCVGKYVFEQGLTKKKTLLIETNCGIKVLALAVDVAGQVAGVRVDMGEPVLEAALVPVMHAKQNVIAEPFLVGDRTMDLTCVSMGNPHAIHFTNNITDELVLGVGPKIEQHPAFPRRTNVEFIKVIDRTHLQMRVWERGSGETMACGTGACAAVVAAVLNDYCEREAEVQLPGGTLRISWNADNHVFKEGPAVSVFSGQISVPV